MESLFVIRLVWLLSCVASGGRVHKQHGVALVQHATNLAKTLASTDDSEAPHHMVCHQHGCKEVQAALEVVKEGTKDAEAKLAECSDTRKKLEQDLAKVSKARTNVTARLMECASERSLLEGKVKECAKHRAETERALAQCASERSALEKELHQCAAIDRPAAEKALAECGVARAKLEKELKGLEDRLSTGAGQTIRNRRRKSSRRRSSLSEINSTSDAVDTVDVDHESKALVRAEIVRVREQLSVEKRREIDLDAKLKTLIEKMSAAKELLDANDADFDDLIEKLEVNAENGTDLIKKVKKLAKRFDDAIAENGKLDLKMSDLNAATKKAIASEMSAAEKLLGGLRLQAEKSNSLLSMVLSERQSEEKKLHVKHERLQTSIATTEEELKRKADANVECDDERATLIKNKAKLVKTAKALKAVLVAKEGINRKIGKAAEAHEKASVGLQKCLAHKTKLNAALQDCEDRCKKTSKLLQECLDRKKVLHKKIEECHSARDLARSKLKECLDRKDELKEKIQELQDKLKATGLIQGQTAQQHEMTLTTAVHAVLEMMHEVGRAEKKAEAASLTAGIFEGDVETTEGTIGDAVIAASEATEQQQTKMESALKLVGKLHEVIVSVKSGTDEADISDRRARAQIRALA